jgi:hypothetical protein
MVVVNDAGHEARQSLGRHPKTFYTIVSSNFQFRASSLDTGIANAKRASTTSCQQNNPTKNGQSSGQKESLSVN